MAEVYREVWTGEVEKGFKQGIKDTFLDSIKDVSRYVVQGEESATIHSSLFGVEPDVLINNTTYPIPLQTLDGTDLPIALDKFQTKVTPITDDELYALSYDKIALVKQVHSDALVRARLQKAIHAFGAPGNTTDTPVLLTTGAAYNGRKRLTWEDIVNLREAYLAADIELDGFRLVLCEEHVNDLCLADVGFQKSYANFKDGIITNQLGFEIRSYSLNPYYEPATKAKLSFGTVVTSTARRASVCFNTSKMAKAQGVTQMYYSEAKTDPQNQRSLVSFRNYFIALPQINKGVGAIVSANV